MCKKGKRSVTVVEKEPPAARKKAAPVKRRQQKSREGELTRPAHILTPAESAAWWKESLCRDPVVDFIVTDEESGVPFIEKVLTRLLQVDVVHPSLETPLRALHAKVGGGFDGPDGEGMAVDMATEIAEAAEKDPGETVPSADEEEVDDDEVHATHTHTHSLTHIHPHMHAHTLTQRCTSCARTHPCSALPDLSHPA